MKNIYDKKNEFDILALGELLIDFAPHGTNEFSYPILSAQPGGAPANFVAAATKNGLHTAFCGVVGNDAFGDMLIDTLKKESINTSYIKKTDKAFTTLAMVTLDETGDRNFDFVRKPGADQLFIFDESVKEAIKKSSIIHFGTVHMSDEPTKTEVKKAINFALEEGKWINFDPNYRANLWSNENEAMDTILWGLKNADSVKISEEELLFVRPDMEFVEYSMDNIDNISLKNGDIKVDCNKNIYLSEESSKKLFEEYENIKIIFITLGKDGAILLYKERENEEIQHVYYPSILQKNTIDTTGAGDIFGGSAISQIVKICMKENISYKELTIKNYLDVLNFATASSSISTTKHGGISSIPDYEKAIELAEKIVP